MSPWWWWSAVGTSRKIDALPSDLVLQSIIIPGEKTQEGVLIQAAVLPWLELVKWLTNHQDKAHQIHWRTWEEIIAAAYERQGWEVTLTPGSDDKGRDVIAVKKGIGALRFLEQVKAYKPDHLVTANEVRAFYGVMNLDQNATKGIISTTSDFAPKVAEEFASVIPYRLELKSRSILIPWLKSVADGSKK